MNDPLRTFRPIRLFLALAAAGLALASQSASAAEWGKLTAKFTYNGTRPMPIAINPDKDVEFCSKDPLVDESLLVSEKLGVANVVMYLMPPRGAKVPVHESYKKAPETVKFDNKGCRFDPHICLVWYPHQKIVLANSDKVAHNTNVTTIRNEPFNILIPPGGELEQSFSTQESFPCPIGCNIHPWMKAHVLPRDNPYFAVSDKEGNLKIENIPAGDWEFRIWHEKSGNVKCSKTDAKGLIKVSVKDGEAVDLGEIKLNPDIFMK